MNRHKFMTKSIKSLLLIIPFLLALHVAHAGVNQNHISPKQATDIALTTFEGDVIRTKTLIQNDRHVYVVRIIKNGHIKEIVVDSVDGSILSTPSTS